VQNRANKLVFRTSEECFARRDEIVLKLKTFYAKEAERPAEPECLHFQSASTVTSALMAFDKKAFLSAPKESRLSQGEARIPHT
jgi:hypothetical protein